MSESEERRVLAWQAPMNRNEQRGQEWAHVAEELKTRPHQWGLVLEGNASTSSALVTFIKKGIGPFAPAGTFEAVSRTRTTGRDVLTYARYVGSAS